MALHIGPALTLPATSLTLGKTALSLFLKQTKVNPSLGR